MKTFTYENIQFLLGQNAQENWDILDAAQKINSDYVWFHLNSFPSSYVIMYSSIENIHDSSLNDYLIYGAKLCKQNSKYKNFNDLKICYTSLKKLTKTNKVGEVIVKGKKNIIKL
tara:strand:- start:13 stop:357 length:345 start_codon:yes stop_codon:yes gene_type:complete